MDEVPKLVEGTLAEKEAMSRVCGSVLKTSLPIVSEGLALPPSLEPARPWIQGTPASLTPLPNSLRSPKVSEGRTSSGLMNQFKS